MCTDTVVGLVLLDDAANPEPWRKFVRTYTAMSKMSLNDVFSKTRWTTDMSPNIYFFFLHVFNQKESRYIYARSFETRWIFSLTCKSALGLICNKWNRLEISFWPMFNLLSILSAKQTANSQQWMTFAKYISHSCIFNKVVMLVDYWM